MISGTAPTRVGETNAADADVPCILAVDDTPANLVALERVMAGMPVRIVRALNGEEALTATLRHRFALAILDVQMPGMDGYELAEIMLADPATRDIPIIFMTAAYFDESHVFRGYSAGAVDYIIKPYNPAFLLAKVRVFLELASRRRQLEQMIQERNRALDASEVRFDDLFRLAPQALVMMTPEGVITHANQAAESLFGLAGNGLKGQQISSFLPEFRPTPQSAGIESGVWRAVRNDGVHLRVELRTSRAEIAGQQCLFASLGDVSERLQAFEDIQRSLREKEVLLKEVHHRVKNNLQIISSLLRLQSDQSSADSVRSVLEDCIGRVRSMAIVHEQLYGSESVQRIDLGQYARSLGEILRGTYAPEARLVVKAAPVNVTIELATPLGLLLNELISNAFKHGMAPTDGARARRTGNDCDVLVEISNSDAEIRLTISDSGPGMDDTDPKGHPTSLGMELVRALSRQINATLAFDNADGLCVTVVIARPREPIT